MLAPFIDAVADPAGHGTISPQRMSAALHMPLSELSRITHLHRNTLAQNPESEKVQERLGEIATIIATAADLTGDLGRAILWFRHQPLSGFEHRTAEDLVAAGHADAVKTHLAMLADGVYG